MNQPAFDLFTYPSAAGWKGAETSQAAAQSINAASVRAKVLKAIQRMGDATADEVADHLRIDKLTIRPRCSELSNLGKIIDSGDRRHNASGKRAVVWRLI